MVNFRILMHDDRGARYRLGVLEIPECFLSKHGNMMRHSEVKTTYRTPDMIGNFKKAGTGTGLSLENPENIGIASIATPSFTVPTFGGLPHCILPKIESDQTENYELASLMPEVDYLLVGHGLDLERVKRRELVSAEERNDNQTGNRSCTRQVSNASKFDMLEQPPPQLANKDYIKYLMFRQPMVPEVSCWNGSDGILVQTESGRSMVSIDDLVASVEYFQPAFLISPAEEAQTGQYGKNVSFRSIQRADEMLLALIEQLKIKSLDTLRERTKEDKIQVNGEDSMEVDVGGRETSRTTRSERPRTKVLANIQGAQFLNYRAAAALGVWDLCRGTGKGLRNVGFAKDKGNAELRVDSSSEPEATSELDEVILGVAIGGLGYSEKSSIRAECIKAVVDHVPDNKLRLISLSTGSPIELLQAVCLGIDIIECPYVYRCSLSGVALSFDLDEFLMQKKNINYSDEEKKKIERFLLEFDFSSNECGIDMKSETIDAGVRSFGGAKYMDLNDRRYSCDPEKLTKNSPVSHSRAYIHHLINSGEILGFSLLFMHNYWQYQGLLLSIRKAIVDGILEDFVTWFIYTQTDLQIHPIKLPEPALETYTFDGMKGRLQKDLIVKSENR